MFSESIQIGRFINSEFSDRVPLRRVGDLIEAARRNSGGLINHYILTPSGSIYLVLDYGDRGLVATQLDSLALGRPDPVLIPSSLGVHWEDPRRVNCLWPDRVKTTIEKKLRGDYKKAIEDLLTGDLR